MDPLLDDSIEFAKRLRDVGNKVELYIVDDLPHGFLSFYMICQEGREANELCIACIKKILQGKRNVTELLTPPIY
jgi:hormone-sensitive lipase